MYYSQKLGKFLKHGSRKFMYIIDVYSNDVLAFGYQGKRAVKVIQAVLVTPVLKDQQEIKVHKD